MCLICLHFSIFICLFESWYDFRKEADIEFTTNTFLDPILQKNMGLYLESMRKKSKKWPRSKIFSKFWCSAKHIDKNRQIPWFELTIFAEGRGQTNYSKCHEFPICLDPSLTSRNQQNILKNIVATHLLFYDLVMINGFHLKLSI